MQHDSKYLDADLLQCCVARHYEKQHGASLVSVGFAPKWDIRFKDNFTMEIKVDSMAAKTFNAAIEYWDLRRGKSTGILETEAMLWLHCIPEGDGLRCYEIDTRRLQRLCFEKGEIRTGGDNNSSVLKLIPLQMIREISNQDFWLETGHGRNDNKGAS
jgi:hypothetical protein